MYGSIYLLDLEDCEKSRFCAILHRQSSQLVAYTQGMETGEIENSHKNRRANIAIVISVLALIVGGISLWDSHKATRRDDERARPILVPGVPRASWGAGEPNASLLLNVRNTGDLTATMIEVSTRPLTLGFDENGPDKICYADILSAKPLVTRSEGTPEIILHSHNHPIVASFSVPASCPTNRNSLGVEVIFTYKDPVNNVYSQPEDLLADFVKEPTK